ncbi:MAG: hypothetical protein U0167_11945 [bacterium]
MSLTYYAFRHAVSAFSRMPTAAAARILPPHLRPMEVQHGSAVFAVTAFDFIESPVGPFQEIVLAVVVPPRAKSDGKFPKAAFYPVRLATSTRRAREDAAERWHLPRYGSDLELFFQDLGERINVYAYEAGDAIVDFTVSRRLWNPVDQAYQSFMVDDLRLFKVDFHLRGPMSVHEEERGRLKAHEHPLWGGIDRDEIEAIPFRELWMKDGVQVFAEIESFETL